MKFEEAISALREGKRVFNNNWNGKNMVLGMQLPDENSKMKEPYIYLIRDNGNPVPWTPSQLDIFSDGWDVVPEEQKEA